MLDYPELSATQAGPTSKGGGNQATSDALSRQALGSSAGGDFTDRAFVHARELYQAGTSHGFRTHCTRCRFFTAKAPTAEQLASAAFSRSFSPLEVFGGREGEEGAAVLQPERSRSMSRSILLLRRGAGQRRRVQDLTQA